MGSFAEDTMAKAKSFLEIYADTFKCVQQSVEKQFLDLNRKSFEEGLAKSKETGEFSLNKDGNIEFGFKYGFFFRIQELCKEKVFVRMEKLKNMNFFDMNEKIIQDLQEDIEMAKKGKA